MPGERVGDWLCGLLLLALVALGGRAVLHLLRPHPLLTSSPWIAPNRTVLLLLLLGAQGSLLLASFWLLAGWDWMVAVDWGLYRVMELICPLALVQASLVYWRGGGETGGNDEKKKGERGAGRILTISDSLSRKGTVVARKRSSAGCGSGLMSFLWVYLWTVAVSVSVLALLDLRDDPYVAPRESSFSSASADNKYYVFDREQQHGDILNAASISKMDASLGFHDYQKLVSALQNAEKNMSSNSPRTEQRKHVRYGRVGVSVWSEVLLYCAFFLPLLCYVAFQVWHFRQRIRQMILHGPPSTDRPSSESEAGVREDVDHTSNNLSDHSFQHNARLQHTGPAADSDNITDNSMQDAQRLSTTNWTRVMTKEQRIHSPKTCFSEEDGDPRLPEGSGLTLYVKPQDSKNLPNDEESGVSETELISASQSHPNAQGSLALLKLNTLENLSARNLNTQDCLRLHDRNSPGSVDLQKGNSHACLGPWPVQPTTETGVTGEAQVVEERGEDCRVCQQVAPYVPLATLVVLVQHVLLLPLWAVLCWSQGHSRLYLLPSCVLVLPVYCALLFTILGLLN